MRRREFIVLKEWCFQEKPMDVVWRFSLKAAPDAREFLFHPTQIMEPQPDASFRTLNSHCEHFAC
jgi:hypothetical protein